MRLIVSTSSPTVSLAIFNSSGNLVFEGSAEAKGNASGRCFELIGEAGVPLSEITGFVADIGPGGFTGLRVGVMLVKTLAWTMEKPAAGVTSFDLISTEEVVSLPAKKGSWLVREPGAKPESRDEFFGLGYGNGAPQQTFPSAANATRLLDQLEWVTALDLSPRYLLEPSISLPKKAYLPGAVT